MARIEQISTRANFHKNHRLPNFSALQIKLVNWKPFILVITRHTLTESSCIFNEISMNLMRSEFFSWNLKTHAIKTFTLTLTSCFNCTFWFPLIVKFTYEGQFVRSLFIYLSFSLSLVIKWHSLLVFFFFLKLILKLS